MVSAPSDPFTTIVYVILAASDVILLALANLRVFPETVLALPGETLDPEAEILKVELAYGELAS